MATQYNLDLASAGAMTNSTAQFIASSLNPSLSSLSGDALTQFENQLAAIGSSGDVTLNNAKVSSLSSDANPLFDIALTGSAGALTLQAGDGFDTITGASGNLLEGSTSPLGAATLTSKDVSGQSETLIGGAGSDTLNAGAGNDTLIGGAGDQTLNGSTSTSGGAELIAGSGDDLLHAGKGSDTLIGGAGFDTLMGGSGNSTLISSSILGGQESLFGGSGYTELDGGDGNDTLTGSAKSTGQAVLNAGSGDQLLKGGAGSDTLNGGAGKDTLDAGTGADILNSGSVNGGPGSILQGGSGNSTLYAGMGHDTLYGGAAGTTTFVIDQANFGNNDVITGKTGASILDLSDLSSTDVTVSTSGKTTNVAFGDEKLTATNITSIEYSNGSIVKLH